MLGRDGAIVLPAAISVCSCVAVMPMTDATCCKSWVRAAGPAPANPCGLSVAPGAAGAAVAEGLAVVAACEIM